MAKVQSFPLSEVKKSVKELIKSMDTPKAIIRPYDYKLNKSQMQEHDSPVASEERNSDEEPESNDREAVNNDRESDSFVGGTQRQVWLYSTPKLLSMFFFLNYFNPDYHSRNICIPFYNHFKNKFSMWNTMRTSDSFFFN